jgi:hypothetical protein
MIKYIILGLILIIILSFFGFDLRSIVEAPLTQNNLHYVTDGIANVWHKYLERPITYLWRNIFLNVLWGSFMNNLNRINSGAPTQLEEASQRLLHVGDTPCGDRIGC